MTATASWTGRRMVDALGLRRLSFVRITVDNGPARATVVGIGHRRPQEVPVTLAVATQLAESGLPLIVQNASSAAAHGRVRKGGASR